MTEASSNFCEGDTNQNHIGDLSAIVCAGKPRKDLKYLKWAERLFESWGKRGAKLRRDTRLWMKAWPQGGVGLWKDYEETSLTFLEYQLMGVANDLFPDVLLNEQGVNRR